eukprot:4213024-Amphidinium_carterae.1
MGELQPKGADARANNRPKCGELGCGTVRHVASGTLAASLAAVLLVSNARRLPPLCVGPEGVRHANNQLVRRQGRSRIELRGSVTKIAKKHIGTSAECCQVAQLT